eukprot:126427_1
MKIIARGLFEVAGGLAFTQTTYHRMCAERGACGVNKYFKSPLQAFMDKRVRITQTDYNGSTLKLFVKDRLDKSLTCITQRGALKAGYSSVAGFRLGVREARELLEDGLYNMLVDEKKAKEKESKEKASKEKESKENDTQ